MKETPILFSAEMVQAILADRKSQTRRVIKPQPLFFTGRHYVFADETCPKKWEDCSDFISTCPYGQPGDRLIFLCTWAAPKEYDKVKPSRLPKDVRIWTLFDGEKPEWAGRLRPGRFMPKWMRSRMPKGEILKIWVEKVQDISEGDAIAEGIEGYIEDGCWVYKCPYSPWSITAKGAFFELWDKIYHKRGYGTQVNPWVWVIKFRALDIARRVSVCSGLEFSLS